MIRQWKHATEPNSSTPLCKASCQIIKHENAVNTHIRVCNKIDLNFIHGQIAGSWNARGTVKACNQPDSHVVSHVASPGDIYNVTRSSWCLPSVLNLLWRSIKGFNGAGKRHQWGGWGGSNTTQAGVCNLFYERIVESWNGCSNKSYTQNVLGCWRRWGRVAASTVFRAAVGCLNRARQQHSL